MTEYQRVRLKFIQAMLYVYGTFSRKHLVDIFGISDVSATRDIQKYREFDASLVYNTREKVFRNSKTLTAGWWVEPPEKFLKALSQVHGVTIGMHRTPVFGVKRQEKPV